MKGSSEYVMEKMNVVKTKRNTVVTDQVKKASSVRGEPRCGNSKQDS